MIALLLAAVIELTGVKGSDLSARAYFDANNVMVGDPMVLTIDFIGEADFSSLHPPALRKSANSNDWKIDDSSVKTDTFQDARRITYRVRPMREGVIWFPALEFSYEDVDGNTCIVRSNEIPVHAKGGSQVEVAGMDEDADKMPAPVELLGRDVPPAAIVNDKDQLFAWRRECANPTADGFAKFDFPEARLNEATCAIREGNWARALAIYRKLEWRIGQTPEIEQGIIAALALKFDNPRVELPVWRQVLRPILRHDWRGRVAIVVGAFAILVFLFWLIGRSIRAIASVVLIFALSLPALAASMDPFAEMHQMMQQMHQQMQQMNSNTFSFSFGGGMVANEPVKVMASLDVNNKELRVGEQFEFILSLEYPKSATVERIRMLPSEIYGFSQVGAVTNMPDLVSANPSNIVKRMAIPVRYDIPFRGKLSFGIDGIVGMRISRNGGTSIMSFSNSFHADTMPINIEIRPLPSDNQPDDFSGIISEGLRIHEYCDLLTLGTNDVINITYKMYPRGYVQKAYLPSGCAFEWRREADQLGRPSLIEYRRFLVADGVARTPELSISYYDPRDKKYKYAKTGGTKLTYKTTEGDKNGKAN